nr:hypothetical protein [Desulfobacteraceae bacterium]
MKDKQIKRTLFTVIFSAGVLASEISLTRIFSVIFWYHFGFLVLSTAMLGFGIGGLAVRYHQKKIAATDPEKLISRGSFICGMVLFCALVIITHNPFHITAPGQSANTIALCMGIELFITSVVMLIPFCLMGAVVLFILQTQSERVSAYYAANLMGSGLGCLLAIVLLDHGGGVNALVSVSALFVFCGFGYAWPDRKIFSLVVLASGLLIVLTIPFSDTVFPMRSPQGKPAALIQKGQMIESDWTSLSRVDIYRENDSPDNEFGLWGLSPVNRSALPERLGVIIDYWAYTTILKHDDTPGYYDFLDNLPMYGMYHIAPPHPRMLIIGSGGGMDIRAGLINGAASIDAVEINPSIFKAMTGKYAAYSGNVYLDKRVHAHLGEGRRFLESSHDTYDIVQLSGVDTGSATQAGAFALTENFLYTKEAFAQYYNHLKQGGLLTLTHWYIPTTTGYPRFSMRLFSLAFTSLSDRGIKDPEKNILLFQSKRFAVLLVKLTPFSQQEITTMTDLAEKKKYEFLYRPDKVIFSAIKFYSYVKSEDKAAWLKAYPFNVTAPTDNSPFYFENRKLSNIVSSDDVVSGYTRFDGQTVLVLLFVEMLAASLALVVLSFRIEKHRRDIPGWLYFYSIGMGFMMVEVSLTQQLVLFLGHPVYALSVVLFSMLIFSGIGSWLSQKITSHFNTGFILLLVTALLLYQSFYGLPLIRKFIGIESAPLRIFISILFLDPVSFLMG